MSTPKPFTRKRRRASDSEALTTSQTRRKAIEETTKREHSKRKYVDDHDAPIGDFFSKKKRRLFSFQPADIQPTRGRKKPFHRKRTPYLYQWLPRRPPWYTSRVYKWTDFGPGRSRGRRRVDKERVQGMENWLSGYDPPFNAFCVDELSASLESLSVADAAVPTSKLPFVPVADSAFEPRVEVEEEEEL